MPENSTLALDLAALEEAQGHLNEVEQLLADARAYLKAGPVPGKATLRECREYRDALVKIRADLCAAFPATLLASPTLAEQRDQPN